MEKMIEKKNNKFYVNGKELPTYINGDKVLDVTIIRKDGKEHPFIRLEDTKHKAKKIIKGNKTIKVRFINNCKDGGNDEHCILNRLQFMKNEWMIVDKKLYLDEILSLADNEFEIDINGEIIVINETHRHYVTKQLKGGE